MTQMAELSEALLAWFKDHQRTLPWRSDPTPYKVWISEIMLQQTQVATVVPYFERWIDAFPDVDALARAPIEEVLTLWSGLGYYRRAHSLHAAAQAIARDHAGRLPDTLDGLLGLPGVGRYTAGAIASIAFELPAPIVDGNVIRVLCRLFAIDEDPRATPTQRRLWALAESLIPPDRARDFNQSLMELGALVCTPRAPACASCPLADRCRALALDRVDALPRPPQRKPRRLMAVAAALVVDPEADRCLLLQRPEGGLFGGLFEFPTVELVDPVDEASRRVALDDHLRALGLSVDLGQARPSLTHTLTHILLTCHPFEARLIGSPPASLPQPFRWVAPDDLDAQPLSSATRKLIAAALRPPDQGDLWR